MAVTLYSENSSNRNKLAYLFANSQGHSIDNGHPNILFPDTSVYPAGCTESGDTVIIAGVTSGQNIVFVLMVNSYAVSNLATYTEDINASPAYVPSSSSSSSSASSSSSSSTTSSHLAMAASADKNTVYLGWEEASDASSVTNAFKSLLFKVSLTGFTVSDAVLLNSSLQPVARSDPCPATAVTAFTSNDATNVIKVGGSLFATLDGAIAQSTTSGCQVGALLLPTGWAVASMKQASRATFNAIMRNPWGTSCVLVVTDLKSGISIGYNPLDMTVCATSTSSVFQIQTIQSWDKTRTCFQPLQCNARILITKDDPDNAALVTNPTFTASTTTTNPKSPLVGWTSYPSTSTVGYKTSNDNYSSKTDYASACVALKSSDNYILGAGLTQTITGAALAKVISSTRNVLTFSARAKLSAFTSTATGFLESDYSVYLDIYYTDGTSVLGVYGAFPIGTGDSKGNYRKAKIIYPVLTTKTLDYINLYFILRRAIAETCFTSLKVTVGDGIVSIPISHIKQVSNVETPVGFSKIVAVGSSTTDPNSFTLDKDDDVKKLDDLDDEDNSVIVLKRTATTSSRRGFVQTVNVSSGLFPSSTNTVCAGVTVLAKFSDKLTTPDVDNSCWLDWYYAASGSTASTKSLTSVLYLPVGDPGSYTEVYSCARSDPDNALTSARQLTSVSMACVLNGAHVGTAQFGRFFISGVTRPSAQWTSTVGIAASSSNGQAYGDPHIVTCDGVPYDFHSQGEFVLSSDGIMTVQTRTEDAGNKLAINTAVAIRYIGSSTSDSSITISRGNGAAYPIVRVDNGRILITNGAGVTAGDAIITQTGVLGAENSGGTSLTYTILYSRTGHSATLSVFLSAFNIQYITVSTKYPSENGPNIKGLIGSCDGNPSNDITPYAAAGTTATPVVFSLTNGPTYDNIYGNFGPSWKVVSSSSSATDPRLSMFYYEANTDTTTYDKGTPSESVLNAAAVGTDPVLLAQAQAKCSVAKTGAGGSSAVLSTALFNSCVADSVASKDVSMATGYAQAANAMPITTADVGSMSGGGLSAQNIGYIVGGVLGLLALIALIVAAAWVSKRRMLKNAEDNDIETGDGPAISSKKFHPSTLKEGPVSSDLTTVMPNARSIAAPVDVELSGNVVLKKKVKPSTGRAKISSPSEYQSDTSSVSEGDGQAPEVKSLSKKTKSSSK